MDWLPTLVEITEVQSNYIKVTNDEGTMQLNRNDSRDINFQIG